MSTPEEDDAWRTIVENFGERAQLPPEQAPDGEPDPRSDTGSDPGSDTGSVPLWVPADDEHFVPEEAPPVEVPRGPRGVAWAGLFGVPVIVMIALILRISIGGWLGFGLLVWFVGGFGYLVATMGHSGDQDGWDDGAVV